MTRQVGPLERQAEHAKVYLKKKEELKECDQNLFLLEMERMDTELEGLEEKCGITEHQQAEIRQKFEGIKSRYEELEKQVAQADEQIGELQQSMNDTGVSKEKLEGQINVLLSWKRGHSANAKFLPSLLPSAAPFRLSLSAMSPAFLSANASSARFHECRLPVPSAGCCNPRLPSAGGPHRPAVPPHGF